MLRFFEQRWPTPDDVTLEDCVEFMLHLAGRCRADGTSVVGTDESLPAVTRGYAVELDRLLSFFHRLPRLPKLADADVLRRCLIQGVLNRTFGLASGSSWNASDAVLRFGVAVDPEEVQFQPGTWLVRASAISDLVAARSTVPVAPTGDSPGTERPIAPVVPSPTSVGGGDSVPVVAAAEQDPTAVTVTVRGVPADKIRDVLKVAVMPLAAAGAEVSVSVTISATKASGISRNTLSLVIAEGLRQLGVDHRIDD